MRTYRIFSATTYNLEFSTLVFGIGVLFCFSCVQKTAFTSSLFDNPEYHYRLGIQQLENGDIELSKESFSRAKRLQHGFALADVGLALASISKNEFNIAKQHIQLAKRQDRRCLQAYIAEGRLIAKRGLNLNRPPNSWLDESLKSFNQAFTIEKDNPEALFYVGDTYLNAGNLKDSQMAFTKILNSNNQHWAKMARQKLKIVQDIERLSPGSLLGKQIGLKQTISRAEMAVLLVEELRINSIAAIGRLSSVNNETVTNPKRKNNIPNLQHWASGWVNIILKIGVPGLSLFPNGDFYHDQQLTRAQCALIVSYVVERLSGKDGDLSKYIGEKSTFPDLKSDHYAYGAASLSVDLGLLEIKNIRTANFEPSGSISGLEALRIIRKLQDSFRSEF